MQKDFVERLQSAVPYERTPWWRQEKNDQMARWLVDVVRIDTSVILQMKKRVSKNLTYYVDMKSAVYTTNIYDIRYEEDNQKKIRN